MKKMNVILFLLCFLITLIGCATQKSDVRIDSIKSYDAKSLGNHILMIPAMKDVDIDDLQFKESHLHLMRALIIAGYEPGIKNLAEVDLGVLFHYGIGEPKTEYFSYSIPIIGQTGGATSTFSGQTYGTTGFSSTSGYIYRAPTFGIVGAYTKTGSVMTYPRWIILEAIDYKEFRKSKKIVPVWKTTITSVGTSDDFRRVFPVMLGAAQDYIGNDTGGKIQVVLDLNDARVKRILSPVR
jgi:hypothetical protein